MGIQLQHGFPLRILLFVVLFLPSLLLTIASGIKLIRTPSASQAARRKTRMTFLLAGFATAVILIAILFGRSCSGLECLYVPY